MSEARITQAGVYVEGGGQEARITQAGVYVESGIREARVTQAGLYMELSQAPGAFGDLSIVGLRRNQAGKQSAFDSAVTPTFTLPFLGDYADGDQEHVADWDQGFWTETTIVERVAEYATFTLTGTMFFEMLPMLINAGWDRLTVSGSGPYSYDGAIDQAVVGSPIPYTFRFGATDNLGAETNAVQIQDAYLLSLELSSDVDSKAVRHRSQWFGRFVDDNDGAGYQLAETDLPPSLGMLRGLKAALSAQDAAATGGQFDNLTAFECEVQSWLLAVDTGLRPKWAGDSGNLYYCGVEFGEPAMRFRPEIRTNADTYALLLTNMQVRQFQELRFGLYGDNSRQWIVDMTGRWLPGFQAHQRGRDEIVMKPTFETSTPPDQLTAPHWLSFSMKTLWEH